jgi:hypothetical protein
MIEKNMVLEWLSQEGQEGRLSTIGILGKRPCRLIPTQAGMAEALDVFC